MPISDRGKFAQSYQLRLDHLRTMAEGWQNVGLAAHVLLHQADDDEKQGLSRGREAGLNQ